MTACTPINSTARAEDWWKSSSSAQPHLSQRSTFHTAHLLCATCGAESLTQWQFAKPSERHRRRKFITELRGNVGGYHSFHSCQLEDPGRLPGKRKQVIRKEYETWKNDKVFTGFKISSSSLSTYPSRCPRPYLTSELKHSQPFYTHMKLGH